MDYTTPWLALERELFFIARPRNAGVHSCRDCSICPAAIQKLEDPRWPRGAKETAKRIPCCYCSRRLWTRSYPQSFRGFAQFLQAVSGTDHDPSPPSVPPTKQGSRLRCGGTSNSHNKADVNYIPLGASNSGPRVAEAAATCALIAFGETRTSRCLATCWFDLHRVTTRYFETNHRRSIIIPTLYERHCRNLVKCDALCGGVALSTNLVSLRNPEIIFSIYLKEVSSP